MRRIGLSLHVSSNKNIIVKVDNLPRIGDNVVDENLKHVGKVADIFGSTSSPYVAVRGPKKETEYLVNRVLYTIPSMKRRWEKTKK